MSISKPVTRPEFREYCLRSLGKGAIKINVTELQVEDAIEEALNMFKEFHVDGSYETIYRHQVTSTDVTNGYITIPDNITSIRELIDTQSGVYPPTGWMSLEYQFMWNINMLGGDVTVAPYFSARQHLELINQVLRGRPLIRFTRHTNQLHIDTNWANYAVGNWILVHAYAEVDPDVFPDIWRDRWLQKYTAAKIKERWANNLSKYVGMKLPGQLEFNAQDMKNDVKQEIEVLEQELRSMYKAPPVFFMG